MAELDCPSCGEPVEAPGGEFVDERGEESAAAHLQPSRERARCPNCGASLVRDARDPSSRWRFGEPG